MHAPDDQPTTTTTALRLEVLGPLRVLVDGAPVDVRGERRITILALLAMAGGRVVPFETMVDAVWEEEPPDGVRQALHSLLSRLRRQLGPHADRLERHGNGYALRLGTNELDAAEVRALAAEARTHTSTDPARTAALLRQALGTWRGAALADVAGADALRADAVALEELRLTLEEEQLEAELAAGRASDLVERAATAAAAQPTREARQLLLMRVLAHAGRAAEALRAGNEYRRRLGEETGLEPGPALAALETRIATGELGAAPAPTAPATGPPIEPATAAPLQPVAALPPRFHTPLLGRDREVAELTALLDDEHLVAVVGPPGVGKTRLAAEVATALTDDDPHGLTFVSLAAVDPTTSLSATVAGALGIRIGPDQTPLAAAVERLSLGRHVLMLDNCEHVLGSVRDLLGELLARCRGLTALVTSRVPTGLSGECVLRVHPLATEHEGVRLFVERARRVRPGFDAKPDDQATIHEIVRRLDGLPLAIELAAGRLSTLSLPDLASRLDDALDLLGTPTGTGASTKTLRSTLDWSYQLLDERHRLLLRHLAEFADGVDLTGIERIAATTGLPMGGTIELAGLVDASLVQADLDDEARYRMLETVRALAKDRQREVAGEAEQARAVMVDWARGIAAEIDATSRTAEEPHADRRLRREMANLRAAHQAALQSNDLDSAIAITVSLDIPAGVRDLPEVWAWAQRLVEWPDVDEHPRFAEVIGAAAQGAWLQGDLRAAEELAHRGVAAGDPKGRCAHALAAVSLFRGMPERAIELWRDAAPHLPIYLASAALAAVYARQLDVAKELNDAAVALAGDRGAPSDIGWTHYVAAEMGGDGALAEYERAIELSRLAGATFVEGVATVGLAAVLTRTGEDLRALDTYEQLIRYWLGTGNWTQQWTTLRNLAVLLERRGDEETAAMVIASADAAADAAEVLDGTWPAPAGTALTRGEVVTRCLAAIERQRQR